MSPVAKLSAASTGHSGSIVDQHVLQGRDRLVYAAFVAVWIVFTFGLWRWWFQVEHVVAWPSFILATIALAYDLTLMPLALIWSLRFMKRPATIPPEPGLRVAMVTAIVPSSESVDVLEQTVAGMVAVRYPHDNWVLDEGGDIRVRALCAHYGVNYWSRKAIPEFNQDHWPFQAKTKSGNYNSWFHQIGYRRYDFLVQLDTDHIPKPEYLDEVLGYFQDPEVAYVALPSVYRNLGDWPARGSSEQSQVFQGIMQMGYYGWAKTPMIIGSHAAYRLSHVKEIGGFAPSRAEDHLDTLKLAQAGYRGVFVPKVLAEGLGPHNLSDYLAQEHQWAFSIAQVLMKYGREKGRLDVRQRVIFLFSELWYGIFSTSYLLLFLLPLVALISNDPIVRVPFIEFLLYSIPVTILSLSILAWSYKRSWLKPGNHFFMSWQGVVLAIARWPIVLIAIANAIISIVFRQGRFNYLVTPKGGRALTVRAAIRTVAPFVFLGAITAVIPIGYALLGDDPQGDASGYVLFAMLSSLFFLMIVVTAMFDFIHVNVKAGGRRIPVILKSSPLLGAACLLLMGTVISGTMNRTHTETALLYWPGSTAKTVPIATSNPSPTAIAAQVEESTPLSPAPVTVSAESTPAPDISSQSAPAVSSWLFNPEGSGVTFGAYDPSGQLALLSGLDHYFIAWSDDATGGLPVNRIRQSHKQGRPVLVSVEPWPLDGRSSDTLLQDIASGTYDPTIQHLASAIKATQQPILIRFGHEMDMQGLYPWAQDNPDAYIAAYRHFVDLIRASGATNVLWVWSPGGELDSTNYYPGDSYVDYVGVSILEYTHWEIELAQVDQPRPLATLVKEKYDLLEPLSKPMILAEVGVDLDPLLKEARLKEMIQMLPNFPAIRAVVYFNDRNPLNIMAPDQPQWALSATDVDTLWTAIAQSPWMEQQAKLASYWITPADATRPR